MCLLIDDRELIVFHNFGLQKKLNYNVVGKRIEILKSLKYMLDGKNRKDIQIGQSVEIVLKQDQRSGKLTPGVVKRILTKSANHPHGIKVELESGQIGRVKTLLDR